MKYITIVSYIEHGDHMDEARKIAERMYADLVGPDAIGFLAEDLMQYAYNKTGEGEPTHWCCFVTGTQYHADKFAKTIPKYGITKIPGNYKFHQIDSEEGFLRRMNLKLIEKVEEDE